MLATYHLFFLSASILLLILGVLFLFYLENKKWSDMIGFLLLGLNTVVCWISILGFHGLEFVAITSTDTFEVYTYPDMYGLWVLPYVLFFITIMIAWIGWGKHLRKLAKESQRRRIPKPGRTNPYWE